MKKFGYVCSTDENGSVEHNTFTCGHCNRIVLVSSKQNPEDTGGWCSNCTGMICQHCVRLRSCTPFEKKLEMAEARARNMRQSYG